MRSRSGRCGTTTRATGSRPTTPRSRSRIPSTVATAISPCSIATGETTVLATYVQTVYGIEWIDDATLIYGAGGDVLRISAGGGTPELVADVGFPASFEWRPGGEYILKSCVLYPIDAGPPVPATPMGLTETACQFTPSGAHVVAQGTNASGLTGIMITDTEDGAIDTLLTTDTVNGMMVSDGNVVIDHGDGATGERTVTRFETAAGHDEFPIAFGSFDDVALYEPLPGWDEFAVTTVGHEGTEATVTTHVQAPDGTNARRVATSVDLRSMLPIFDDWDAVWKAGAGLWSLAWVLAGEGDAAGHVLCIVRKDGPTLCLAAPFVARHIRILSKD